MKKILLLLSLSFFYTASAQTGSISNFYFVTEPIEIGETLSFSLDYTSDVDAYLNIALLKSQNGGSQIDWGTGMHWQNVNVPASTSPANYIGTIHLSGFHQSSADIAPEVYLVMVQLVNRSNNSSMAAVSNWGIGEENTITILPSPDVFNYNYLGEYDTDGKPLYLEAIGDNISASDLETIGNSLPESYPVPEYNPHYISAGYDTDLIIEQDTDVWVTFISEGAGYTNVLGYYTYDVNNPLTVAPQQEDITIIFPNASELGAGGGLVAGDKVNIGNFPAGTGIGWVLLANAWNGVTVGHDIWHVYSNPDFNPESDAELRHHSILLTDTENERLILGFEDVRRDLDWCDQDFNDAVFYVTVDPYTALNTTNYAEATYEEEVTSGNDGGLESNGSLANLIAKRNFKRVKTSNTLNKREAQQEFKKNVLRKSAKTNTLLDYLPETSMYGTEVSKVSSPEDLLEITNAKEIFSVDYYKGNKRISAVLATKTEGSIYDHSKAICDRLNNSILEDIRAVTVRNHQIISSKIKRPTGETEYTLSFSIKENSTNNELFSLWNISQYPKGNYKNFQIWGSSYSQVFSIANYIIDKHSSEKMLKSSVVENVIPEVFVQSGYYSNGKINLNIINTSKAKSIEFNASIASSEVSDRFDLDRTINLTGNWKETISIETGILFDIGFSLQTEDSKQKDALYLADGPWGLDYLNEYATVSEFNIDVSEKEYSDKMHEVDRNVNVVGEVKGNVNLFRHILPGDQTLDVSNYGYLNFLVENNEPLEIVIMQEEDRDWSNRIRYTITSNTEEKAYNISFNDFVDGQGKSVEITNIKTIVFSIIGDYTNYKPYNLSIKNVAFGSEEVLSVNEVKTLENSKLINYPNPFTGSTTLQLSISTEFVTIQVFDMLGRTVDHKKLSTESSMKQVKYYAPELKSGIYKYRLKDDKNKMHSGSFIIN